MEKKAVEASREQTDADLAEERGKTDVLLEKTAPDVEREAAARVEEAVAVERAETDGSLRVERKEVDELVDETKAQLEAEQESASASRAAAARRDEFLAMVSHDLRNPLALIGMNAEMIARFTPDSPDAAMVRTWVTEIVGATERMRRMIVDLLDFTAMEAGVIKVTPVKTDVRPLVAGTVMGFARGPDVAGPSLRVDAPPTPLMAHVDPDRIRQVLVNLIANAVKFTDPKGSVVVRVSSQGDEVLFAVHDTGVGIRAGELAHVFERFWQLRRSDRRGLGLGLYICKGIVEAHGGRIWATSEIGRGSEFLFTVPAA